MVWQLRNKKDERFVDALRNHVAEFERKRKEAKPPRKQQLTDTNVARVHKIHPELVRLAKRGKRCGRILFDLRDEDWDIFTQQELKDLAQACGQLGLAQSRVDQDFGFAGEIDARGDKKKLYMVFRW